jgi:hypothetical protein
VSPVDVWNFVRNEGCCFCLSSGFGPLAYFTSLYIGLYVLLNYWPPVVSGNLSNGAINSFVACDRCIVVLRDYPLSKVLDMWYQHLLIEKQNSSFVFPSFIPSFGHSSLNVCVDLVILIVFSDFCTQCFFLVDASNSATSKAFYSSCCLIEIFCFFYFCLFVFF